LVLIRGSALRLGGLARGEGARDERAPAEAPTAMERQALTFLEGAHGRVADARGNVVREVPYGSSGTERGESVLLASHADPVSPRRCFAVTYECTVANAAVAATTQRRTTTPQPMSAPTIVTMPPRIESRPGLGLNTATIAHTSDLPRQLTASDTMPARLACSPASA
jgi:hypothetical protein